MLEAQTEVEPLRFVLRELGNFLEMSIKHWGPDEKLKNMALDRYLLLLDV